MWWVRYVAFVGICCGLYLVLRFLFSVVYGLVT